LKETQHRLFRANEKNRQNLDQFHGIQNNMEQFNAESLSELQDVVNKSHHLEAIWHDELFKHERNLLHTVFDRFCSYQNHVGMTKKEFDEYINQLPVAYQERFGRMGTFAKIAGNKDVILLEDFEQCLDIFAEMQASNIDIEFQIKPTKNKRKFDPSMNLIKKKTEYFSKRLKRVKNEFVEEENEDDKTNEIEYIPDDDRKYDDDLIRYQSQIVITRRTTPGLRSARSDSIASSGGNDPCSPGAGRGLYRRTNMFGANVVIQDILEDEMAL